MKPKTNYAIDECANSGIHELRYATYKCSYVGQTSLNLKHTHQEHLRYIKHNDPQLAYSSYILNNVREYGRVDNIMSLVKQANIQRLTNEFLRTILYSVTLLSYLFAEQNAGTQNAMYQIVFDLQLRHASI
jgi:hypothetical protein